MNDWRLLDQDTYLTSVPLERRTYHRESEDWNHDHCEFCNATFSEFPGDLHVGYTTLDSYYWICDKCFNDFKDLFRWKVIPGANETDPG